MKRAMCWRAALTWRLGLGMTEVQIPAGMSEEVRLRIANQVSLHLLASAPRPGTLRAHGEGGKGGSGEEAGRAGVEEQGEGERVRWCVVTKEGDTRGVSWNGGDAGMWRRSALQCRQCR